MTMRRMEHEMHNPKIADECNIAEPYGVVEDKSKLIRKSRSEMEWMEF